MIIKNTLEKLNCLRNSSSRKMILKERIMHFPRGTISIEEKLLLVLFIHRIIIHQSSEALRA
jgi:hypothetical protein